MIISFYQRFFIKKIFYKLNKFLFLLSAHGLGILNYESKEKSGERYFIEKIITYYKNRKIIVFDVGANHGDYSRMILEANNDAFIYAFEPHPKNFKNLAEFAKDKKNVQPINKGCGDVNSEMIIYDMKDQDGSELASLYKKVITGIHRSKCSEVKADIIRLDDFCQQNGIEKIDLLKVDVEGNEFNVLQGASEIIGKGAVNFIHFEFNSMNVMSRTFFRDFYDFLKEYRFFRLLPDGMVDLGKYDPLFWEIFSFQNIVAVRKDIFESIKL